MPGLDIGSAIDVAGKKVGKLPRFICGEPSLSAVIFQNGLIAELSIQRMLDLTPKAHQDYLSTFSLSRSIEFVLKVMTEVKIREDDYDFLKTFASKIRGLTPASGLATRERRLLHSGPLQLVISDLRDLSGESVSGVSTVSKRISRSSRLLDAIGKSNYDLGKAFSPTSGSSSMAADNDFTMTNISSSPVAPSKSSWFSRLPLRRRSRHKSPSKALPLSDEAARASPDIALRTVDVHAFVFNDLVLLAQKEQSLASEQSWILSEDVGIFRPLSIARLRRRHAQGRFNGVRRRLALINCRGNDYITGSRRCRPSVSKRHLRFSDFLMEGYRPVDSTFST